MPDHDIVVVGASAGGVEALVGLAASLPAGLPAAVFVVLHVPSTGTSALPDILSRHGRLPASHVNDGEPIEHGRIYVAPPDHHLLVRTGHLHLARGPRENGHRPAVDPLFRSAAREYATRVVGVVLSGALDDGTAGLVAIKSRGGVTVVQDPEDALYPGMPGNALEHIDVDHVLPAAAMGALLARLALEPASAPPGPAPTDMKVEVEVEGFSMEAMEGEHPGEPSGFSCPDCNGVLWGIDDGGLQRFRCRVGHAWSPESLLTRQSESWRRPCGSPCAAWRSGPRLPGAWPSRPGAVATASPPPASRSRPPRPSRRPGWSATCCWAATASPPPGRWSATGRRRR
jgi:two-component system, chemotaxis family, protein-glutamate methylesterase/glutaminase